MTKKFIAGGCSFTFGHELSDDNDGKIPSKNTWAYRLMERLRGMKPAEFNNDYICTAKAGAGNQTIARRIFNAVANTKDISCVAVMWSFLPRYDWAMPQHRLLEDTRWTSITPWDTNKGQAGVMQKLANSEPHKREWKVRRENMKETGVGDFADALYKYASNDYHEIYLSWKSIIWLQNILEKRKIPFVFTLADNSLFYDKEVCHCEKDSFMKALYNEIDFTKWASFGERMMGFNQWALINDYERGITHPLDKAHLDAVQLIKNKARKILGVK